MFLLIFLQVVGLARVGERTAGIEVGRQYEFVGTKYLARLGHEVNATHHDNLRVGVGSLLCQSKRVADEVCHLLYFATRVVVSQHDGVFLTTHLSYLFLEINVVSYGFVDESLFFPFFFHHLIIILFFSFFFLK